MSRSRTIVALALTTTASHRETGARTDDENPSTLGIRWVFPEPPGRFTPFGGEVVRLGRQEGCEGRLEGNEVSRLHAEIRREKGAYLLRDCGSRNGTFVDGVRRAQSPLLLGSVIRVGEWVGVFSERADDEGEASPFARLPSGLIVGPISRRRLASLFRVAKSDLPVVLIGETGVGKELVAKTLHALSGRRGPYRAVNCAAIPESLAEAELFGYRQGAFTGAAKAHPGLFREANGGTLLLDELADLPAPIQAKLLRVLQEREVQGVGELNPAPVDVRVVAAGQESLLRAVAEKKLRADLWARLNGLRVSLPTLAERRDEILPLFRSFLDEAAGGRGPALSAGFAERLCLLPFAQNVRELQFMAKRAAALQGDQPILRQSHFAEIADGSSERPTTGGDGLLDELVRAVKAAGGNVSRAAKKLGITRPRAYRLLQGTDLEALRGGPGDAIAGDEDENDGDHAGVEAGGGPRLSGDRKR